MHPRPPARPIATTESVEELVREMLAGQMRIPDFQRGLKWQAQDVLDLFDSIHRGYPIGSLLFSNRPAEAGLVRLGPLKIEAPEKSEAWWVVDGQQRLTALAAALTRPSSADDDSFYTVFFDPQDGSFYADPSEEMESLRVPVHQMLDSAELSEWMFSWRHHTDAALRRAVFEAGKRIREYKVPMYLIQSDDDQVLREIFYRTNNSGKSLSWQDVHDALFGSDSSAPSTVEDLSIELSKLGMGELRASRLMSCLIGFRGADTTRTLPDHYRRDPELLRHAVRDGLPVLRRVFSFLRKDVGIPHLRFMPRSHPLEILARFFGMHPEPKPRSRILLSRWLWRIFFNPPEMAEATLRRRGVGLVDDHEELSVQRILELSGRKAQELELPPSFDAREAGSRLVLCALAWQEPLDFESGLPLDLADGVEIYATKFFGHLVPKRALKARPEWFSHPGNRVLHPPGNLPNLIEQAIHGQSVGSALLRSHLLDGEVAAALRDGDGSAAIEHRIRRLTAEARKWEAVKTARVHSDRPSLDFLLEDLGIAGVEHAEA